MSPIWQQQLADIYRTLLRYKPLWQQTSYGQQLPSWFGQFQELYQWLMQLDDASLELFESDHQKLVAAVSVQLPELNDLYNAIAVPVHAKALATPYNARQFAHIPGRKLEQICHFVAALPQNNAPLIEWCSGKGHLGRMFAQQHQCDVVSLEYDQTLCEQGLQLAQRSKTQQRFVCHDALAPTAAQHLADVGRAVALHACGDLHLQLIDLCISANTQELAISPCCYHLTKEQIYQPRSLSGQQHNLELTQAQLRLAVQQTSTAPARVRRLRAVEVSYRLGLKALLQQLGHSDAQLGSSNKKVFSDGFESFVRWACERLGVALNSDVDFSHFERLGAQGWHQQRRCELARQLFRPAIEHYLVLDRALYLQEQGYEVSLSRFCDPSLTPRNYLLFAKRLASA